MPEIIAVTPKIGLEIHIELATRSKVFSRAANPAGPDAHDTPPNTLIDPVVLALPGSLPVVNRTAVGMAMLVGLALNCRIADVTRWDRKNYFYPDLPKAYQISQYDLPVCFDGAVDLPALDADGRFTPDGPGTRIGIIRAHLEEDAGKLLHEAPGGGRLDGTMVDLNRAGTPLLEIVTQPDFTDVETVVAFARFLRTTCRFLGVTEGDMQRGHMRFEPNINAVLSLPGGRTVETPIVEVKNLNSFRSLKAAIEHELAEQPRRWRENRIERGPGTKRTRGWDDRRLVTVEQREKEEAHDYRYFPDPDLPPLEISRAWVERVRATLPELPTHRMLRYMREHALGPKESTALSDERAVSDYFEACVDELVAYSIERHHAGKIVASILLQSAARRANERGQAMHELGIAPRAVARIAALRAHGEIAAAAADELFGLMCLPEHAADDPATIAQARGMILIRDDTAINAWCDEAINAHPQAADDVRAGRMQAIGRLVGEVMKRSGGQADAADVRARLLKRLGTS